MPILNHDPPLEHSQLCANEFIVCLSTPKIKTLTFKFKNADRYSVFGNDEFLDINYIR